MNNKLTSQMDEVANTENHNDKEYIAAKSISENYDLDSFFSEINEYADSGSFDSPWDMILDLPELPIAPDIFSDRNSSDFDPRPAISEITDEDWDEKLQPIFLVLKAMIRQAINVNSKPRPREMALRWIFVPECPGPHGLIFLDACGAFGARPLVLQARVMHQFWISNIPLRCALPDEASGLPLTLASEIEVRMRSEAIPFARAIWRWPGIRADVLVEKFKHIDAAIIQRVLSNLESNGYIALRMGFWYFISRNFESMTQTYRRNFSWAQSFIGDE